MSPARKSRDVNKPDVTLCMVPECHKKALYRNASSTRGYCASHKAYAVQQRDKTYASQDRWFDRKEAWRDSHLGRQVGDEE